MPSAQRYHWHQPIGSPSQVTIGMIVGRALLP